MLVVYLNGDLVFVEDGNDACTSILNNNIIVLDFVHVSLFVNFYVNNLKR